MLPMTDGICPYCGFEREKITFKISDESVITVGYRECHCEGATEERIKRLKAENAQKEQQRAEAFERKLLNAGIPKRYLHATDETAPTRADEVQAGSGLYIFGHKNGTGKTNLAMAIAIELMKRGVNVKAISSAEMLDAMRSDAVEDRDATQTLIEVPVLLIDDLGKENPTAYACERLGHVINQRYNAMLPTIITSNYSRGEIAKQLSAGGNGYSIASRLNENTKPIKLEGEDRRLHGRA